MKDSQKHRKNYKECPMQYNPVVREIGDDGSWKKIYAEAKRLWKLHHPKGGKNGKGNV